MQRFTFPIVIALAALLIGIGIGRYRPSSAVKSSVRINPGVTGSAPLANPPPNSPLISSDQKSSRSSPNSSSSSASSGEIIAKIKSALTRSASRHTYATFSKLSEAVDASNVREVLAFVQTLPKPQEKSMLVSLCVARWAELEPQAAIAYAEALPPGTSRNWALTSAVTGWAETDPAAATAWFWPLDSMSFFGFKINRTTLLWA